MIKEIEEIQSELDQKPALRELMKEAVGCTRKELHLLTNEMLKTNEIWKDIEGYEGVYQVSNFGRIKTVSIWHRNRCNGYWTKEKIRRLRLNHKGYVIVTLSKNKKLRTYIVHRLVAKAFIPNSDNLPEVNHKDENKENNNVNNLEWCTSKYNSNYGTKQERRKQKIEKKVYQYTKDNQMVKKWNSAKEAGKYLDIAPKSIAACCRNTEKHHTAGGFKWKYVEESK